MIVEQLVIEVAPENSDTWRLKLIGSVESSYHLMQLIDDCDSLLNKLVETNAQKLVIDLTATEYLGSQGLQFLLNIYRELSKIPQAFQASESQQNYWQNKLRKPA